MFVLRAIEVGYDEGVRYVKLIVRDEHGDMYRRCEQKTGIPVNQGTVRAMAAGAFGHRPGDLVWPHHIEARDI